MPRRPLRLARVYQLLEPGPVVLVTTARGGRANIMTMSWHMMVDFEPPIVACVVSNRNYSFELLRSGRECALNIPTVELAAQVVGCGNTSGRRVDKFAKFGLTAVPASRIRPPLIAECYANLECRVIDTRLVNRYNIFILEVLQAWRDTARRKPRTIHHQGNGAFMVAGRTIRLKSRMP
jgi:flavin reductase (DIM6/NTAB) family NADH-FMN oxidoreductase RutF